MSTGLRVSRPLDDAAVFAIAHGLRSNISACTTVRQSLGVANARPQTLLVLFR